MSFEYMLPPKWVIDEKMPSTEGTNLEFKEAFRLKGAMQTSLPKYRETLIGLLNVGGGYLVLGVTNKGVIQGMEESDDDTLDKFRVWVDAQYGSLLYRDGSRLDPQLTSLKVKVFPVEQTDRRVIAIEAFNTMDSLQIQTGSGEIIYRLNASNYKLRTEPIYRHRDVQGLIRTVQIQMQGIIKEQHDTIRKMNEKHHVEMARALQVEKERNEKAMRLMIHSLSANLYGTGLSSPIGICNRLKRFVCCIVK